MAAKKGNEYWKKRTKHGRAKIFSSPEMLWEAACEYFKDITENPITKKEITTKPNGKEVKEYVYQKPFTWEGLELFLDIASLRDYKTKDSHKDFLQVITRIEKIIYTNKFEGASVGIFNSNIIARDLGLKDSSETKHSGEIKTTTITALNKNEQAKIDKLLEEFKNESD